ncbi:MAG: hypothetical protein U0V73_16570 [Acidimicrobiia bacterium]
MTTPDGPRHGKPGNPGNGNPGNQEEPGFAAHPDLAAAGAAMRAEWREDEELYAAEALAQWQHGRRLADVFTELMHRGDTVAITLAHWTFTGVVVGTGDDLVTLRTGAGRVDVHTALPARVAGDRHALVPAPVVVRVVERATAGGIRQPERLTFRARLHELVTDRAPLALGCASTADELRGLVTVGRDHVHVRGDDGAETYLPLAWVSWVRRLAP